MWVELCGEESCPARILLTPLWQWNTFCRQLQLGIHMMPVTRPAIANPPRSTRSIGKIPEVGAPPQRRNLGPVGEMLIARVKDAADLTAVEAMPRGPERRVAAYEALLKTANESQVPVISKLQQLKTDGLVASYESMFLPNALVVKAMPGKSGAVNEALRGVAQIDSVSENKAWSIKSPQLPGNNGKVPHQLNTTPKIRGNAGSDAVTGAEWGIELIGAPKAWSKGFTGEGVTVGIVDTGLDFSHPAIIDHYRGKTSAGVDHNYNWFDPFTKSKVPFDDGEHGTHVAGSTAGGAPGKQIGVAPGAKLIAAKAIMGSGYNTTVGTLQSLQFMLAPTDLNGQNPDPRRGADVVNNSWGNADQNDRTFIDTWKGLVSAGITPVAAAGNDGPRPGTVSPPGSYATGITVAATDRGDRVAGFSSRGPSKLFPDAVVPLVAAPGDGVHSSTPGGRYKTFSGTSMASPHVAGAVALMLQAKPDATDAQIAAALTKTAKDVSSPGIDLDSGYGRIDVDKAIAELLNPTVNQRPSSSRNRGSSAA